MIQLISKSLLTAAFAAVCAVFMLAGLFTSRSAEALPTRPETGTDDRPIAVYSLADLAAGRVFRLDTALYTPGEYLHLFTEKEMGEGDFIYTASFSTAQGETVTLGSHRAERTGTYQFVVTGLDPAAEDYEETRNRLEPFLQGDENYHVTLWLPGAEWACTVYERSGHKGASGGMTDYSPLDYGSTYKTSSEHYSAERKTFSVELIFPAKTPMLGMEGARIVTIHYESQKGLPAGLSAAYLGGVAESRAS